MPMFLCHETPYLRILDPDTGDFIRFDAGRLVLDAGTPEGDRWLPIVTAEMNHNAAIRAIESIVYCPECAESFIGQMAQANLAKHRQAIHPLEYLADVDAEHAQRRNMLIAGTEGFACSSCPPGTATFGTKDELVIHTRALHANRPDLDAVGNTVGGDDDGGGSTGAPSPSTGRRGARSGGETPTVKVPPKEPPKGLETPEGDDGSGDGDPSDLGDGAPGDDADGAAGAGVDAPDGAPDAGKS